MKTKAQTRKFVLVTKNDIGKWIRLYWNYIGYTDVILLDINYSEGRKLKDTWLTTWNPAENIYSNHAYMSQIVTVGPRVEGPPVF